MIKRIMKIVLEVVLMRVRKERMVRVVKLKELVPKGI